MRIQWVWGGCMWSGLPVQVGADTLMLAVISTTTLPGLPGVTKGALSLCCVHNTIVQVMSQPLSKYCVCCQLGAQGLQP